MELRIGDHLKSPRTGYTHHGVYVGDGQVIHYSGLAEGMTSGPVAKVSLEKFAGGADCVADCVVVDHPEPVYSGEKAVQRAISRLGEDGYDVFSNNCEHFVNWCIDGDHKSGQIDRGTVAGSGGMAGAAGLAARAGVAAAGPVAGLSASGVMSGLATTGAVVGGGVVAGIGVVGGAGGAAARVVQR